MRRRYVQLADGTLVDVTDAPTEQLRADAGALWGDRSYDGLRATDGTPIDTRTKHREYMKRNNLSTVDDYKDQWARQRKERDAFLTQGADASRRGDIIRALEKHG